MKRGSRKKIKDLLNKPAEKINDLSDYAYAAKNALKPGYRTVAGLQWRKVKRSFKRLIKGIRPT